MKKVLAFLTVLVFLLSVAFAEETAPLAWQGYELRAVWMTANKSDIGISNLREDGQFVLVRLAPVEGTISRADAEEHAWDDMTLRLSSGEDVRISSILYRKLIRPEEGGFPSVDPQQDSIDLLFFLEGGSEADLEGALLVIPDGGEEQEVALEEIPREMPEN